MIPAAVLIDGFRASFGTRPAALVAAPGRINLVGDHIDYLLLPVLPMALQCGIGMAVRPREDDRVRLVNAQATFAPAEFAVTPPIPPSPGDWSNYVRAALAALPVRTGFDAFVASDLPAAAGLSSSSALVVAAALAACASRGETVDRLALAGTLARGERFVGTEGGGMDQAVVLCARAGTALRIDFAPLRTRTLPVPDHWRFLVLPSFRESRKSAELRSAYNERARTAHAALARLAPGLQGDALLHWLADPAVDAAALPPRPRHVLTEVRRVLAGTRALERAELAAFGAAMTASHASLRDDYQVSTPELDELVDTALEAGAAGARLTGAGFGGCAIALCTAESEAGVRRALVERFYRPRAASPAALFTATPSSGAAVTPL